MQKLVFSFVFILIVIALLGVTSRPAAAQQRIAETVIVTATASPVPFENLARDVTVLTREDIARIPALSAADLIRYVGGVEVWSRGPLGVQADFSLRGATFGQTLVLVNGMRINDVQSGHHNSDIPVAVEDIERIEVLHGPGSSLYGADAFGGTINVITRRRGEGRSVTVGGGSYDFFTGHAAAAVETPRLRQSVSASLDRTSGFTFARDFRNVGLSSQTTIGATNILIGYLDKDFGANGFYGASPSKEWTDQTLVAVDQDAKIGTWSLKANSSYRTHGDRFLWDVRHPGVLENLHRTHAIQAGVKAARAISNETSVTIGTELGYDWLRSSNLGDHTRARASAFGELQWKLNERVVIYPGLRVDTYRGIGTSANPSASASVWISPRVRVRPAVARAFRVPSFTELYYRDPNHEARSSLTPEQAWGIDVGIDWLATSKWYASVAPFRRWERDVIDWVRPSATVKWQTTNVRRVDTSGVELALRRFVAAGGLVDVHYTFVDADAQQIGLLSKYVQDYARHSFGWKMSFALPGRLEMGHRLDYRRRVDGRRYWVLDARISQQLRGVRLFVEGWNLLDRKYQEVLGVDMPPRWLSAGVQIAR